MPSFVAADAASIPTSVAGLNHILHGGYAAHRGHLIEGRPGSGKVTPDLQSLIDGLTHGQTGLHITLSESKRKLLSVADEDTIRVFRIDAQGLRVGDALSDCRGVITGVPTFDGDRESLLVDRDTQDRGGHETA